MPSALRVLRLAGAIVVLSATAFAQSDMESIIMARQSNSRDIGGAYRELNNELKNPTPVKFLVQQYVGQMADLAGEQITWFPPGSGPEAGVMTAAKANIWTDAPGFKKANDAFKAEAEKLRTIAMTGDNVALAAQAKVTAHTCKTCHDTYKEKDERDFQFQ